MEDKDLKILQNAANTVIKEVMEAGFHQRTKEGKPTDEWKTADVQDRIHHAFMHLVRCQSNVGIHGHPFSLTDNTALEDWKHALCGLVIVAAHELGYMDFQAPVTVDSTEDEVKGE